MTFIKRPRLRDNWPLWVAITLFSLVLLCLSIYLLYPIEYPYDAPIAYPLVIFYNAIILPLTCVIPIAFLLIALIATVNSTGRMLLYLILLAIVASIIFCRLNSSNEIITAFIAFICLNLIIMRKNLTKGIAPAIFMLLAVVVVWIPFFGVFWTQLEHRDSIQFDGRIYTLALKSHSTFDVCISNTFMVYECDSLGLMCKTTFQTNSFPKCSDLDDVPKQANLKIDDELQSLILVLDDESLLVVPQAK
jgi:hypothetical protein